MALSLLALRSKHFKNKENLIHCRVSCDIILIFLFIIFNPEVTELALFIDAVGLEIFFMLVEVQIIVAFGLLQAKLSLSFVYVKKLYQHSSSRVG
ncbi:MAG: hypothetical protein KAG28_06180 [Cocleimonas sp.]|nr:hypothetical protein [Cocleimonas sp.]